MHKIQIAFGAATGPEPVPVKVILDDHELQGVAKVEIALNDEGITSVLLTLVSTTIVNSSPPLRTVREKGE